jgi:hypothetical protein
MYKLSVGKDCAKPTLARKWKRADMRIDLHTVPV